MLFIKLWPRLHTTWETITENLDCSLNEIGRTSTTLSAMMCYIFKGLNLMS